MTHENSTNFDVALDKITYSIYNIKGAWLVGQAKKITQEIT